MQNPDCTTQAHKCRRHVKRPPEALSGRILPAMALVRYRYLVPILHCILLLAKAEEQKTQNGEDILGTCLDNAMKSVEVKIERLTDLDKPEKKKNC